VNRGYYIGGYLGLIAAYVIMTFIRSSINLLAGQRASRKVRSAWTPAAVEPARGLGGR
jgi:hypothetical protein